VDFRGEGVEEWESVIGHDCCENEASGGQGRSEFIQFRIWYIYFDTFMKKKKNHFDLEIQKVIYILLTWHLKIGVILARA
jgi:hypothetical protein